jgi:hypothetical protein
VRNKIRSHRWSSLAEFDLSILLSVLIVNYQDLSDGWPDHGWSTVHEMLHIRNKCAHQPASSPPPNPYWFGCPAGPVTSTTIDDVPDGTSVVHVE